MQPPEYAIGTIGHVKTEDLIARHPEVFHVASADSWPSIAKYGLLSTSALLDLHRVSESERAASLPWAMSYEQYCDTREAQCLRSATWGARGQTPQVLECSERELHRVS